VIGGIGHDMLQIDETEAAKDNLFDAGLGVDFIEYLHSYDWSEVAEPTVTIKVNDSADTDLVIMTGGRVGSTLATDTLMGVEYLRLGMKTAESVRADDVIDVTAMTDGAVVDYTNGEIRDLDGDVQLTIENIFEMENVWADGDDTVIVGDEEAVMSLNEQHNDDDVDITFATFIDYDELDVANQRIAFADQTTDQIQDVNNLNLFTFDLSHTGDGDDSDTVDYSQATADSIATAVTKGDVQYVLVDGDDGDDTFGTNWVDRVDQLIGVERIVASQGESVLDFTSIGEDVEISFQFDEANADAALDRMESIVRIGDAEGNTIDGIPNYVEYFDLDADDDVDSFNNAAWTRIEGGDDAESVFYDGSEDLVNMVGVDHRYTGDILNLRGGENNVSYYALETSITASINVTEFDDDSVTTTGLIDTAITFQNGNGDALPGASEHTITSYTGDNGIAAGSLKLEASQDAEDTMTFESLSDKVFLLGRSAGVIDVEIGDLDAMRLTGFEFLEDAISDDIYDMDDINIVIGGLTLVDNDVDDEDTIKVDNSAVGYQAAPADTIDLGLLNLEFGFDFDILDVTNVTDNNLTLIGDAGGLGYASVVEVDPVASDATNSVLGDTPVTIDIGVIGDHDWYQVDLVKGQTYQFDLAAGGTLFDPTMELWAPDGTTSIDYNDDFIGLSSQIIYTATETDTYYIDAGDYLDNNIGLGGTLTVTTRDIADDGGDNESVVMGDLDLIDDIQLFDALIFTDASITSAGDTFTIDMDARELLDEGNNALFTFDGSADTFDFSRLDVEGPVDVQVSSLATGATVIGSDMDDTITGDGGADVFAGGAGDDTMDGGIATEVRSTDMTGALAADGAYASIDMFGLGNLVVSESLTPDGITTLADGAGTSVVGQAMADLLDNNLAQLNADYQTIYEAIPLAADAIGVVTDVSWAGGAGGGTFTFTFAPGVDVPDTNDFWAMGVPDGGDLAFSSETVVADGGSSLDTFVFEDSALANGMDTINNFDDSDILDFSAFNPTTVNEADNGGTAFTATYIAATFGSGVNEVVVEWDSTVVDEDANVWFMSDLDANGGISADEVSLVGVITEAGDLGTGIYLAA